MTAYGDDDYQPQSYQDDLSTDDSATDPIMSEENDDPTEELGILPEELEAELLKELDDEDELDDDDIDIHDDQRESVEGRGDGSED